MLLKEPRKDWILSHPTITLLTPVFSSKILIPPKETVKKTFCLCSPFDRAAATIPCGNKEQLGWFHGSPRSHRSACGQFTTFLGKLKDLSGTVPSLLLASSLFSRYHMSLCYPESISNVLPLPTPALANPAWNLFSWKLKVISSTLFPAISCSVLFIYFLIGKKPNKQQRRENANDFSLLHFTLTWNKQIEIFIEEKYSSKNQTTPGL